MNGLKFIISLISFNLLVSQAGLNVYMLYCCCKKNIEYSFLPQQDDCVKKKSTKNCCAKSTTCSSNGLQKGNCKSHFVEYKSFNSKAPDPNAQQPDIDFDIHPILVHTFVKREIKLLNTGQNYKSDSYILSGSDIIIRKCNWLC